MRDAEFTVFAFACSVGKMLCQDKPGGAPFTTDPFRSRELQSCTHHIKYTGQTLRRGLEEQREGSPRLTRKLLEFDLDLADVEEGQPQAEGLN